MSKPYYQADLGYPRRPCPLEYHVCVNRRWFSIPAQVIVDARDAYYRDEREDTWGYIEAGELDLYDIRDWASGNMGWNDVAEYATVVRVEPDDFQEAWVNGDYEFARPKSRSADEPQ